MQNAFWNRIYKMTLGLAISRFLCQQDEIKMFTQDDKWL